MLPLRCIGRSLRRQQRGNALAALSVDHQGSHDVGASTNFADVRIDIEGDVDQAKSYWETATHALMLLLNSKKLMNLHQLRRGVEQLTDRQYAKLGYYDKWALSIHAHLTSSKLLDSVELDRFLGPAPASSHAPHLSVGTKVRVKREDVLATRWRRPHLRVPGYIFGCVGEVVEQCGVFEDPEAAALPTANLTGDHQTVPVQPLYRVRFQHADVVVGAQPSKDTVDVELTENWLTSPEDPLHQWQSKGSQFVQADTIGCAHHVHDHHHHHHDHHHHHHHADGTEHDEEEHHHEDRGTVEQRAVDLEGPPSVYQQLSEAMIKLLQAKGIISPAELARFIEFFENADKGVLGGAKLVARAWKDEGFRQLLLSDATAAAEAMGLVSRSASLPLLKCVENTDHIHNLIVCTLCSCYPVALLGRSPNWYKSRAYRARAVREPRSVLAEFGTDIGERQIRVHDSTAELRYLVLPQQPPATDSLTEEQLQLLISRDAMIGARLI